MFTGALEGKTYGDLIAFLSAAQREGVRLDYKADFPRNLEKTISAMANTEGGLILVGVEEEPDRPGFPKTAPVGVPLAQAVERVVEKAYQAISEPLFPEVAAIPLTSDPTRCVVAIRVQPSERAPHAVDGGRDVYVRVDSQSLPADFEQRMGLDRLQWLFRRREVNTETLRQADSRWRELLDEPLESGDFARITITVRPVLAHANVLSMDDLRRLAERVSGNQSWTFPDSPLRSVVGGFVARAERRETYVDVTGLTAYARSVPIGLEPNAHPPSDRVFQPAWLPDSIVALHWAGKSAVASGRGGTLLIQTELARIKGAALFIGNSSTFFAERKRALQSSVSAQLVVPSDDLAADPAGAALELLRQVGFAFDYDLRVNDLRAYYKSVLGFTG